MDREKQNQHQQESPTAQGNENPETAAENTFQQYNEIANLLFASMALPMNQNVTSQSTLPSHESGQPFVIQPPIFASASQAALEDANQARNIYAIQTSVEPVERESNNDSPFFECLSKLFDVDGNDEAHAETTSHMQCLMDPLAWLPPPLPRPQLETGFVHMSEPTPLSSSQSQPTDMKIPTDEPPQVQTSLFKVTASETPKIEPTNHQVSGSRAASSKDINLKPAPVKATVGKVKPAGVSRHKHHHKSNHPVPTTPFEYFKNMLAERGYSFGTIKSVEVGYMIEPSPLQIASFGTELVNATQTSDVTLLSSLLGCGLSPNPCNQFKDSVLSWVCKKANAAVFQCFVDHNADLRFCDGFGRTPLHHLAWADTFSPTIASAILQRDPVQLFLKDNKNQTPLEYVPSKLTTQWIEYLELHKEEMFPTNGAPIAVTKRENAQLPDPPNAISVDLAKLVSAGQVQPEQIATLDEMTRKTWKLPT